MLSCFRGRLNHSPPQSCPNEGSPPCDSASCFLCPPSSCTHARRWLSALFTSSWPPVISRSYSGAMYSGHISGRVSARRPARTCSRRWRRELLCEGTKEIHNLQPPLCRRSPAIDSTLARKVGSSCHQGFRCCAAALSLTLAIVPAAQAQTATTFEEAISPQYSYAEAVRQTSDGGYVVGATFSIPPYAALVAKLDWSGNLQSQKQYQSSIGSSGRT